jgi:peptidoglycan-associated lipoprotein
MQGDLGDVFFDFDQSGIRSDAEATLAQNGSKLVEVRNATILIEGHCDERGTHEYNLALGDRRATAAKDFLISYGVESMRIDTISYGESRPFATGSNEQAWAQNRRAHFVVK